MEVENGRKKKKSFDGEGNFVEINEISPHITEANAKKTFL